MAGYTPLPIVFPSPPAGKKKSPRYAGVILLAAALVGAALYVRSAKPDFFAKDFFAKSKDQEVKKETESLIKKVSRHLVLPQGETPTIATVQNAQKFKDKPFFNQAKNGDKLLIFAKSRKIVLYRPAIDKVIDVGFYNPKDASADAAAGGEGEVSGALLEASPTGRPAPSGQVTPTTPTDSRTVSSPTPKLSPSPPPE